MRRGAVIKDRGKSIAHNCRGENTPGPRACRHGEKAHPQDPQVVISMSGICRGEMSKQTLR